MKIMASSLIWRCYINAGRVLNYLPATRSRILSPQDALPGHSRPGVLSLSTGGTESAESTDWKKGLRQISEMPGPKSYALIGTIRWPPPDMVEVIPQVIAKAKEFYPIYRERLLGRDIVILVGVDVMEAFFRKEAKYPSRIQLPMWMDYRKQSGEAHGVLTGDGANWHSMRSVVDKPLLRMKDITAYAGQMNEVITDFLARLDKIRDQNKVVPDLETELFNWSLESIGSILYETRFGGMSGDRDPEMEEFIKAVDVMLTHSTELFIFPIWFIKLFKSKAYKEHHDAWDTLFRTGKRCIDERMEQITTLAKKGEETEGILSYLLGQNSLTIKEVYSNVTEIMMGAVDTTSNTTLFVLYEIARRPEIQEKLYREIEEALPDGKIPAYRDIHNLPYLRATVKETLRLYPAANSLARVIDEDMELSGYYLPKKTAVSIPLYAVSRMTQHFDDPYEFRPERWLRDRADRPNPFASIPFGFGTRMCVGRRVAELELHLLLSRLLQRYRVEPDFTEPIKILMKLVLRPDRPLRFKFINRK